MRKHRLGGTMHVGMCRVWLEMPENASLKDKRQVLRSLIQRFYNGATASAIAHLLETEDDVDEAALEELEELLRAKREGRAS